MLYADEIRGYDSTEEIANDLLSCVCDGVDLFAYPEALEQARCEDLEPLLEQLLEKDALCLSVIYPCEDEEA